MKVAIYARVSTKDKDQNPETQLLPLREYCTRQNYEVSREYVDLASAQDALHRTAWRELLDHAARRRFDLVIVWRIDRAFRSVIDGATTLERLRKWNIGLRSYTESWIDTTSPFGEAMYHITIAYAQLEREILRERVIAGMDRVKKHGTKSGKPVGHPNILANKPVAFRKQVDTVLGQVLNDEISLAAAAEILNVGKTTIKRWADEKRRNGK
ncbi:MAG: recombinase family protein [Dehalococcoidales bacterium]|nr:recombinase family protein [Dehalococcoidales bacterium]